MAVETVFRQDGPHDTLEINPWTRGRRLLGVQKLPEQSTQQNDECR